MDHDQQEERRTFLELYDRLGRRLLLYLGRGTPNAEVAAELWAESWAVAFENWRRRRSKDPGSSEAWVFGIARHQLAAYYRSGSIERRALERLRWVVAPIDGALDGELERIVDRNDLRPDLVRAMNALPPKRRHAVQLRIVDGVDYSDIAVRLGCSEQTARAHVSRGLRRLAKALERDNSRLPELTTR